MMKVEKQSDVSADYILLRETLRSHNRSWHLLVQSQQCKLQNNFSNLSQDAFTLWRKVPVDIKIACIEIEIICIVQNQK